MIILLSGASETARALVVDKILDAHEDWHHLALEDLRDDEEWVEGDATMEDVMGTMVACDIAADTVNDGGSVVVTCPSLDLLQTVHDGFSDEVTVVHIGTTDDTDEELEHVLDPAEHSTNAIFDYVEDLMTS